MKLRKLFIGLLILLVVLGFAGCGGGGGGGGGNDDPAGDDNGGNGGNGGGTETAPNYLCFTSTGKSTISLTINGEVTPLPKLKYSKDKKTWEDFIVGSSIVEVANGEKIYFRGTNNSFSKDLGNYLAFVIISDGSIAASGNIMSLLDESCESVVIPDDYCFNNLFNNCTALTKAPELPATTLTEHCYESMFYDCKNLTEAPELPATTLIDNCYDSMFSNCEKLTKAPELPATTLVSSCYRCMFQGCSSLNWIKVHFANNYPQYSTQSWVSGVAAEGTFECPTDSSLIADHKYGPDGIPNGWEFKTF